MYSGQIESKPRSIYLYSVNNTSYVITNTGILLLERDYVTFRFDDDDNDDEIVYFTVRWKTRASFVYRTKNMR